MNGRCWCGAEGEHEHMCGGGLINAFHPGYLLVWWRLISSRTWGRKR